MITSAEIVRARQELLERTVTFFSAQQDVIGVFLGGSLAAGTADAYSDIDLRVIATPEGHSRLLAGRLEWPAQWGELLFNEWVNGAQVCVSHFRPFFKVDVFYWTPEMFNPSPWLKLPAKILLDRTGIVGAVLEQSKALPFAPPEEIEVSRILSKALATIHETLRRVRRGELLYAQTLLEQSRSYLMQLESWMRHWDPTKTVNLRMDHRLSGALKQVLERSYVGFDAEAIEEAVVGLANYLRDQIPQIHERFRLERVIGNDEHGAEIVSERQLA